MYTKLDFSDMRFSWLTRTLFPDIVKQMEILMATVTQILEAIAAEKEEVRAALQALKDIIAGGGTIKESDLDAVLEAITDIHTAEDAE